MAPCTVGTVTGDNRESTQWKIYSERLVDENPFIRLSIAPVGLPDGTEFEQYVMGHWWASWQTSRSGVEKIASQEVEIKQETDTLHIAAMTRGLTVEEGGYLWSGELRLWDNEILMGWYASYDGSIRSKGTMYFVVHPHGLNMSGRWVGLGYDDQIMTGFAAMAHSREESEAAMARLIHSGGEVTRGTD